MMKRLILLHFSIALFSACTNNTEKKDSRDISLNNPDSLYHYAVDSILRADIADKDYSKARRMLEKAIEAGHVGSMTFLGANLIHGWDFERDERLGSGYLRKAAQANSTTAMYYLATGYFNKSNMESSIFFLRKCSNLNDTLCTYTLGYLLTHGNLPVGSGKIRTEQIDYEEGLVLLEKAAAYNHSDAQVALAYWYIRGIKDHLEPDTARAKVLLLKAQDDAENLGISDRAEELLQSIR